MSLPSHLWAFHIIAFASDDAPEMLAFSALTKDIRCLVTATVRGREGCLAVASPALRKDFEEWVTVSKVCQRRRTKAYNCLLKANMEGVTEAVEAYLAARKPSVINSVLGTLLAARVRRAAIVFTSQVVRVYTRVLASEKDISQERFTRYSSARRSCVAMLCAMREAEWMDEGDGEKEGERLSKTEMKEVAGMLLRADGGIISGELARPTRPRLADAGEERLFEAVKGVTDRVSQHPSKRKRVSSAPTDEVAKKLASEKTRWSRR